MFESLKRPSVAINFKSISKSIKKDMPVEEHRRNPRLITLRGEERSVINRGFRRWLRRRLETFKSTDFEVQKKPSIYGIHFCRSD